MKTKTFLLTVITLCLMIGGTGCERTLSETELMKQKLIGTWEWIVSYNGGFIWESKPRPGEKLEILFTDNHVLITHNLEVIDNQPPVITDKNKVIQDGSYFISKENEKYYITITPKEDKPELDYLSGKREILFIQPENTLSIGFTESTYNYHADLYKKVNK